MQNHREQQAAVYTDLLMSRTNAGCQTCSEKSFYHRLKVTLAEGLEHQADGNSPLMIKLLKCATPAVR